MQVQVLSDDVAVPLTASYVRDRLDYDPETGVLTWRRLYRKSLIGTPAGTLTNHGYLQVKLAGKTYLAHRLAWLHATGEWPRLLLDHINHNKVDNRLANLREVDYAGNAQNMARLPFGAKWNGRLSCWETRIKAAGRTHYGGLFDDPEDAHKSYLALKSKLHIQSVGQPT